MHDRLTPSCAVTSHMSEREIEEKKVKREGLGESEDKTERVSGTNVVTKAKSRQKRR